MRFMIAVCVCILPGSCMELIHTHIPTHIHTQALVCICILLPQQEVREKVVEMVGRHMKDLCKRETLRVGNERVGMVMVVLKGLVSCV
ncbi:hypothetical protein EON63_19590 [archaeon]|nr:MAG: hypothetical protein EON63_19590 [archaeon]